MQENYLITKLECIFHSFICTFIDLKFTESLYVTGKGNINEKWSQSEKSVIIEVMGHLQV